MNNRNQCHNCTCDDHGRHDCTCLQAALRQLRDDEPARQPWAFVWCLIAAVVAGLGLIVWRVW